MGLQDSLMSTLKKPDLSDPKLRAKLAKGMGHNYYGEPAWPNDLLYIFPVVILGTTQGRNKKGKEKVVKRKEQEMEEDEKEDEKEEEEEEEEEDIVIITFTGLDVKDKFESEIKKVIQ